MNVRELRYALFHVKNQSAEIAITLNNGLAWTIAEPIDCSIEEGIVLIEAKEALVFNEEDGTVSLPTVR